jgi:GNAT superfamily N-acetyltransferase
LGTEGLLIRRAALADVPRLVDLLIEGASRALDEALADDPVYARAFAAIDADPNQLLLVGEQDGEVVATLQVTFLQYLLHRGRKVALVEAVRVAAPLRGLGIGAQLLGAAIDEAKGRGCARVQLTTNKQRLDAHRFYARLGFVASHEGMKLQL